MLGIKSIVTLQLLFNLGKSGFKGIEMLNKFENIFYLRFHCFQFSQNPDLKRKLLKTHPKLMVEASPSDLVWGIGLARDDPLAWDQKNWRGKNQLGYIMTKVRDMIMEQEKS